MRQKTPTKPSIEVKHELELLSKRMAVANRSSSSIRSYCRAIEKLSAMHECSPRLLEIDQLIDFLYHLQHDKGLNWRTIKLYVAGYDIITKMLLEMKNWPIRYLTPKRNQVYQLF